MAKNKVIIQPDFSNLPGFRFNPIFPAKEVISSIGQILHQNLPNNMAVAMISGHQYDHTIKFERFVFRKTMAKSESRVVIPIAP
jgi:hypothetical protein